MGLDQKRNEESQLSSYSRRRGREGRETHAFEHLLLELSGRGHSTDVTDVDAVTTIRSQTNAEVSERKKGGRKREREEDDSPIRSIEQPLPQEVGDSVRDHAISLFITQVERRN